MQYKLMKHKRGNIMNTPDILVAAYHFMKTKLTKSEFESYYDIRSRYESFKDEYGDAAGFYSDYLDVHYNDYLNDWFIE